MSSAQQKVITDILAERQKSIDAGLDKNDIVSQGNDWIAYTLAYLGRASEGVYRNQKEQQDYRANLVKAGGLIVSALVAYDRAQERKSAIPETVVARVTA